MTIPPPAIRLDSSSPDSRSRSFSYAGFQRLISAHALEQVRGAVGEVEAAVADGYHAAGFISYEAGAALNPELPAGAPAALPLVWFALFSERHELPSRIPADDHPAPSLAELKPLSAADYHQAVAAIRNAIAAGETYQVNYSVRQQFSYPGDPLALYHQLCRNQQADYCAYIDTGQQQILSASPELFFSLKDRVITMRPMKGTAPRLARSDLDRQQIERLRSSAKERAENLMIVDMVRNDLSRIAEPGSVSVPALFEVSSYPTLHQMTSTVTARLRPEIGLMEILAALFPCASITGAPKRQTMAIINRLEDSPRGVYCGAIGFFSPGGEATFSVAIRTAVLDAADHSGVLGLGSGITWDSDPQAEFAECCTKGEFLRRNDAEFRLIETLRHDRHGYLLLERHLARLTASAAYFGFRCCPDVIRSKLQSVAAGLSGLHKVRLLLAEDGSCTLEAEPLTEDPRQSPATIALSTFHSDPADRFLYHKTTRRQRFQQELNNHPGCYDVIFTNQRGEVTEGCYNNIVISLEGKLLTPALDCGLLPGVLREELLAVGGIEEASLTMQQLQMADNIWLVNSVRGWRECIVAEQQEVG